MKALKKNINYKLRSSFSTQAGQAMVEYILVVFVSVIIVGTLVSKMYKPLDQFIGSIMGTYVACLLETGELPKFGTSEESSECKFFIPQGEDSETAEQRRQNERQQSSNQKNKIDNDADKANPSGSRRSSYAGPGSSRGNRFLLNPPGGRGSQGLDAAGAERKLEIALDGGGAGSYFGSRNSSGQAGYRRRDRYIAFVGTASELTIKNNQPKDRATLNTARSEAPEATKQRKIAMIKPATKDKKFVEEQSQGLDISQIVKIILIAGIIIIIVVLLGGQALQLSKSWQKSGS
jgi:hypothetical protein